MNRFDLPNNLQLEQEILTAILSSEKRLDSLLKLKKEYFYNLISQKIFDELIKDTDINITVLKEKLKKIKISKILEFVANVKYSGSKIEPKIDLLKELYIKRNLKKLSVHIDESINKFNSNKIITSIDKNLYKIAEDIEFESGKLADIYEKYKEMKKDTEVIKYGIENLDKLSNGHRRGQIWVLGGSSGIGKSFFVLNVLMHNLMMEKRVLFFSTELVKEIMFERLVNMFIVESGIDDFKEAAECLADNKNALLYDSIRTPENIIQEVKRQKVIGGCDLVIIDHIQDIRIEKEKEKLKELETICDDLKDFAIKEKIAILVTSQLNDLGQFKHARKIREVATMALILKGEKNQDGEYKELKDLIIDKNRIGKIHGIIKVQMDGYCIFRQAKFYNHKIKDEKKQKSLLPRK